MFRCSKIKDLRQKKRWSLSDVVFELAKKSHRCTRQTVLNWETGVTEPNASGIAFLADVFDVTPEFFFSE